MSQFGAVAAVAAFGGLALLSWREKVNGKQMEKKAYEIEKKHAEMLETMCTKFKIKSIDKAVRIVVQFAITEGAAKKKLLDDVWSLEKKRCNTCGDKKDKVKKTFKLYGKQHQFLEEMTKTFGVKDTHKALRCLLEYCQTDGDKELIFSTKNTRCKNC